MKQTIFKLGLLLTLITATTMFFSSCKDGLTKDIHNIIPKDIMKKFKELGIEINEGNNPPNIEGTYFVSPFVLVKSNFNDNMLPGDRFSDMEITFSGQNNTKQTVVTDYINGTQIGNGLGSFITGSGNKFSVYYECSGTYFGLPFKSVDIYSGEITSTGIKNFQYATIVTEPNTYTIKRGEGRLAHDSDKFSEKISSTGAPLKIKDATSDETLKSLLSK